MVQPTIHLRQSVVLPLAFLFSFCSLAYQQILVLGLTDITGDFVLSQSLGLGAFLLGMGIGSALAGNQSPRTLLSLIKVELALSAIGFSSIFFIYTCEFSVRYFFPAYGNMMILCMALPYIGSIGFLTGQEVPLLIKLSPNWSKEKVLGWTYFGGLLAMICVPLILVPTFDLPKSVTLTAALNLILSALLILTSRQARLWSSAALALVSLMTLAQRLEPVWTNFYLRAVYFPVKFQNFPLMRQDFRILNSIDAPIRQRTRYQWIDVVAKNSNDLLGPGNPFGLFLDRKFQFSDANQVRYHEAMAEGAVNLLARSPERVLILGGGDGLLLPYLLKQPGLQSIDLVELDRQMIELSRQDREISNLNKRSLDDPRVKIHIGDAFHFVKSEGQKYDLILIDLPLPTNYDLSLLYSREFYSLVLRRLKPEGVAVLDFAAQTNDLSMQIHTLLGAQAKQIFAFGLDDLFIAFSQSQKPLNLDYKKLDQKVSNQSLLNFFSRFEDVEMALSQPSEANSIFFPHRFFAGPKKQSSKGSPWNAFHGAGNSRLLELFLSRFWLFHNREVFDHAKTWPSPMIEYWKRYFSKTDAFTQHIGGEWNWPKFQWEHHLSDSNSSIVHWFDFEAPEKLRELFKQQLGTDAKDAVGFRWDLKNKSVRPYYKITANPPSSLDPKAFEAWALSCGDELTYFSKDGAQALTFKNGELKFTRYFSKGTLNATVGSQADILSMKFFNEFMLLPSSYSLSDKVMAASLYYP